jgi:hypothetical protein
MNKRKQQKPRNANRNESLERSGSSQEDGLFKAFQLWRQDETPLASEGR